MLWELWLEEWDFGRHAREIMVALLEEHRFARDCRTARESEVGLPRTDSWGAVVCTCTCTRKGGVLLPQKENVKNMADDLLNMMKPYAMSTSRPTTASDETKKKNRCR